LALVPLSLAGRQGFNRTSQSSDWSRSLQSRVGNTKASSVKAYPKPIPAVFLEEICVPEEMTRCSVKKIH